MARRDSTPLYKLIVLGDGGVGKTALTIQLCLNHFVETYDPTIEDSYRKKIVLDGEPSLLEVLDTAGQEEYTALRDQWIREGEGFILVYSITSRSSFTRIRAFFNQIQRAKEDSTDPFAVVIVGNKSDKVIEEREVSTQEGEALAHELGDVPFFESSAKYNINIENSFLTCASRCKQIRELSKAPQEHHQASGQPNEQSRNDQQQQQQQQLFNDASAAQYQPNNETFQSVGTSTSGTAQVQAQANNGPGANSNLNHRTSKSGFNGGSKKSKKDKKCVIM